MRTLTFTLTSFLLASGISFSQPVRVYPDAESAWRTSTIMSNFNLVVEAADADQIVTTANGDLTDSKTFTLTAQPDSCRLIDMTVTDADSSITAGTVTFTGLDCLGTARICTFDFSVVATRGSGIKTLPVTTGGSPGSGCYLASVTSIISSALTGEGGAGVDYMSAGYTTNSANGWAMFGTLLPTGPSGEQGVDPFVATRVAVLITTTNALSTTVTGTGAFADVVAGDLLLIPQINSSGVTLYYERLVTARASADSITVNSAIKIPTAGVYFSFKHKYFSTDPTDHLYVPVKGWKAADFIWSVDSNTSTGGVVTSLQCARENEPDWPTGQWVEVDTSTVTTGSSQAGTLKAIDSTLATFDYCKFGIKYGTSGTASDINVSAVLSR